MKTNLVKSAWIRRLIGILAAIVVLSVSGSLAAAQKSKKGSSLPPLNNDEAPPLPPGSDADQIDHSIGEMLAGFQLGNVEMMHKYYADNVTFVSGDFAPPIVGWQNYVPLYQRQATSFSGIQLVRRNTVIFPHGDVAWAMYQWEFSAYYNGRPYNARGQTTLIFNKIGGNWLIVHNHTSEVPSAPAPVQPSASAQQQPAPAKH
jgi:ketosteroid isomerase-like protein